LIFNENFILGGPVTLQWFYFDVKNGKPAKKNFWVAPARPGAASKKCIGT
jgi:hypothetical protein